MSFLGIKYGIALLAIVPLAIAFSLVECLRHGVPEFEVFNPRLFASEDELKKAP